MSLKGWDRVLQKYWRDDIRDAIRSSTQAWPPAGDHGSLSGLSDDDHPQYVLHSELAHNILSTEHSDTLSTDTPAEGDGLVYRSTQWVAEAGVNIASNSANVTAMNAVEQSSDPTAPSTARRLLYCKAGGWYDQDDAGNVTGPLSTGGGTDANAVHVNASSEISGITEKGSPANADLLIIEDSAASNAKKKIQIGNIPGLSGAGYTQACRVYNSADISIANNSWTALTFNSEDFDTDSMHSTSSNTSRITFNTAGKYQITGLVFFAASSTGARYVAINKNAWDNRRGQVGGPGSALDQLWCVTALDSFTTDDYVELYAYQNRGSSLNVTAAGGISPIFMAARVG